MLAVNNAAALKAGNAGAGGGGKGKKGNKEEQVAGTAEKCVGSVEGEWDARGRGGKAGSNCGFTCLNTA